VTPEKRLQQDVLEALGRHGRDLSVYTNPVGQGFYEGAARLVHAALAPYGRGAQQAAKQALYAQRVRYGLAPGSADLVAVVAPHGRLCSLELKAPSGRLRPEQEAWIARMRNLGAVAGVARSVEDAELLVDLARKGR
jgi:hypothetical protein